MNAFHNAAKSYKKSNPEGKRVLQFTNVLELTRLAAVSALHQAIKLLINAGNFRQAADREKEASLEISPQCFHPDQADRCYIRSGRIRRWKGKGLVRSCRRLVQARRRQCVSLVTVIWGALLTMGPGPPTNATSKLLNSLVIWASTNVRWNYTKSWPIGH